MKKLLLIALLAAAVFAVGCKEKKAVYDRWPEGPYKIQVVDKTQSKSGKYLIAAKEVNTNNVYTLSAEYGQYTQLQRGRIYIVELSSSELYENIYIDYVEEEIK